MRRDGEEYMYAYERSRTQKRSRALRTGMDWELRERASDCAPYIFHRVKDNIFILVATKILHTPGIAALFVLPFKMGDKRQSTFPVARTRPLWKNNVMKILTLASPYAEKCQYFRVLLLQTASSHLRCVFATIGRTINQHIPVRIFSDGRVFHLYILVFFKIIPIDQRRFFFLEHDVRVNIITIVLWENNISRRDSNQDFLCRGDRG